MRMPPTTSVLPAVMAYVRIAYGCSRQVAVKVKVHRELLMAVLPCQNNYQIVYADGRRQSFGFIIIYALAIARPVNVRR